MAESRNYFVKAGLSVRALSPITPKLSIPDVVQGLDVVAVAHGPQVVLARAKGSPVVILGSLISSATAAMIWLKESSIGSISDLEGKTIAIPGLTFQELFLENVLAQGELSLEDVKIERVGNELVPALTSGRADAIFGGSENLEGADLEARGLEPVVTPVTDLGFPQYEELMLVARSDVAARFPELMCNFVSATHRGAVAGARDPRAALAAIEGSSESNPEVGRKAVAFQVAKTLPLLSVSGYANPAKFQQLVDWMYDEKMIQRRISLDQVFEGPG